MSVVKVAMVTINFMDFNVLISRTEQNQLRDIKFEFVVGTGKALWSHDCHMTASHRQARQHSQGPPDSWTSGGTRAGCR